MDEAPAFWDAGSEHGHQVVALGFALALTATAINLALVGRLTMFFDLAFITLSLTLAVVVRRQAFFVVALLPPLLMIAVFAFLALVAREAIADPRDNFAQAVVTGVTTHGIALFCGYALCLGWLGWRLRNEAVTTSS